MVGYCTMNKNYKRSSSSNNNNTFVMAPDHSMLHETHTPHPLFHFIASSLPTPSPPHPTPFLRHNQMEGVGAASALKKGRRTEAAPPPPPPLPQEMMGFVLPDDVAWAVEQRGEEFSIDDLLVFDGFEALEDEAAGKGGVFEVGNGQNTGTDSAAAAVAAAAAPPLSDINLPTHDAAEFEWMSSIIDDSLPEFPPAAQPPEKRGTYLPPPPPPPMTSVCAALVPVKAKRSKRPRTAGTAWPVFGAPPLSDSSVSTTTTTNSSYSSCSSSPSYSSQFVFNGNLPSQRMPKKRGRKPKLHHHLPPSNSPAAGIGETFGGRHCTHCGTLKTPQWRTGPRGPKTLCNACGVRYKSGRLVPEYRPAASPTFVSHVHSNSHRKVLEMRRKKEEQHIAAAAPPVTSF